MLALLYRSVGGWCGFGPDTTFINRVRFCTILALFWAYACLVKNHGLLQFAYVFGATCFTAYLGRMIPHGPWMATASLPNALMMALVGLGRSALLMLPVSFCVASGAFSWGVFSLALFGALQGVAYYVGNRWLDGADCGLYFRNTHYQWRINAKPYIMGGNCNPDEALDQCAYGGASWGELLTGLLCYQIPYAVLLVVL